MIRHASTGKVLARRLEMMRSSSDRARGLLKFSSAPDDYAAVFFLPLWGFFPMIHTLGMAFSIDMIFLDKNRRILFFEKDIPPGRFVLPWKYFFGGCRYLVEFSKCDLPNFQLGDELCWEAA